jgi:hypothetical protein
MGDKLILHLLADFPDNIRDMIVMVLWQVWYLRNELSHGKSISSTKGLVLTYAATLVLCSKFLRWVLKK